MGRPRLTYPPCQEKTKPRPKHHAPTIAANASSREMGSSIRTFFSPLGKQSVREETSRATLSSSSISCSARRPLVPRGLGREDNSALRQQGAPNVLRCGPNPIRDPPPRTLAEVADERRHARTDPRTSHSERREDRDARGRRAGRLADGARGQDRTRNRPHAQSRRVGQARRQWLEHSRKARHQSRQRARALGPVRLRPAKISHRSRALEATGIGFVLGPNDVAIRGNFCTLDAAGKISDRRAGASRAKRALPWRFVCEK